MTEAVNSAESKICSVNGTSVRYFLALNEDYKNLPYDCIITSREVKELVDSAEKALQETEVGKSPNIRVDIPADFTHELYLKIFNRFNAIIRYKLYKKLKEENVPKVHQKAKESLESIDKDIIINSVCNNYKIVKAEDDDYALLLERIHYFFLKDKQYCEAFQAANLKNEKIIEAIINKIRVPKMNVDPHKLSDLEISVSVCYME